MRVSLGLLSVVAQCVFNVRTAFLSTMREIEHLIVCVFGIVCAFRTFLSLLRFESFAPVILKNAVRVGWFMAFFKVVYG